MTDEALLERVARIFDPGLSGTRQLTRRGRCLLVLPEDREASRMALSLYQPQRPLARLTVAMIACLTRIGAAGLLLPGRVPGRGIGGQAVVGEVESGTLGILMGSPEHRVRRAVASYRRKGRWEVAKLAFGPEGAEVLEREAAVISELTGRAAGVPALLGFERLGDVAVLRMPRLCGRPLRPAERSVAIGLLEDWICGGNLQTADRFAEWPAICRGLTGHAAAPRVMARMSGLLLRPVICHGDFARWNLLMQDDGRLRAVDWEWGHWNGMPGIDAVHLGLQDARLVHGLSAEEAITLTMRELGREPWASYLARTGWPAEPLLPIIACLAYKQGAAHQDNREMLEAACVMFR